MEWLATPTMSFTTSSFSIKTTSRFNLRSIHFQSFSGGMSPGSSKSIQSKMLSVVHTHYVSYRPTLSNPHFKLWCYIIFVIMCMKDPTKLKRKPTTHLDLFLDQCLYICIYVYIYIYIYKWYSLLCPLNPQSES